MDPSKKKTRNPSKQSDPRSTNAPQQHSRKASNISTIQTRKSLQKERSGAQVVINVEPEAGSLVEGGTQISLCCGDSSTS